MNQIAQVLGYVGYASWDKIHYLGLPLSPGINKDLHWAEILNQIKEKMKVWGGQWFTTVGKLILVNFVLSSLPLYQATLLLAPKSITDQLSKMLRNFLWQEGKSKEISFGKLGHSENTFIRWRLASKR